MIFLKVLKNKELYPELKSYITKFVDHEEPNVIFTDDKISIDVSRYDSSNFSLEHDKENRRIHICIES